MSMQQCLHGHLYDDSQNSTCPYCFETVNIQKKYADIEDVFRNYKVVSEIGKGKTGTVYRVENNGIKAVKVIECGKDDSLLKNAKREYEFMKKARECANVINGYDMKVKETAEGNTVYILEEFATPFFEHYRFNKPSPTEMKRILLDICEAVKQLRNEEIVHLDIKPDNIFITKSGEAKLGDYSHVAYVSELGSIEKIIGTPKYMAPEIFEKIEYNNTIEVYALGIVMHCLLTGEFPFDFSDRNLEIRKKDDKYIDCTIDIKLISIIKKATAYYSADRYCSVDELKADIADVPFDKFVLSRNITAVRSISPSNTGCGMSYYCDYQEPGCTPHQSFGSENLWENVDDMAYTCALDPSQLNNSSAGGYENANLPSSANMRNNSKLPKTTGKKIGIFGRLFGRRNKEKNVLEDLTQFTAAAPSSFKRNGYTLLKIMMHHENDDGRVEREIKKLGSDTVRNSTGIFLFNKGEKIRIVLQSPDIVIDDNVKQIMWNGVFAECTYSIFVPENYEKDQIVFKGRVYKDDAVLTDIVLVASIESDKEQLISVEKCALKSAFVSYASQDRAKVVSRIQGIKAARHDIDIFFDVESLRCGEKWETRLYKEIESRNIFYLFWSINARCSDWVKKELTYAIKVKGIDYVEPIPLEPPEVCPPPEELKEKHFNDWTLRYLDK